MKLLLIDAYALIYRSYYAFIRNPRVNSKGMNTSAIFGFINSLDDALRRLTPTHAAIAFDPAGPTFRHEAFPEYKAQREKTPEDIHASEPYIRRFIEARHIPLLEVARYEADDVIGTIATQAAQEQFDVYMMTPDKDYGQLVTDRIFQFRPRHGGDYETMGTTEVLVKYGLADVRQVVDLLGLMGDASDNIPGCPGVGEKTAQKLLTEFGSIERLLESTDQLKGALRTKIETHAEQIRFSKFLATIVTDAPIRFDAAACAISDPDRDALRELYTELEFRSFLTKLDAAPTDTPAPGQQLSLFANEPTAPPPSPDDADTTDATTTPHTYHLVDTDEERRALAERLNHAEAFAFDTETEGVDALHTRLVGMSFAVRTHEAWYVPVPADEEEARTTVAPFAVPLQNAAIQKVGQNIKFDLMVLIKYGIRVDGPLFDTMIAHYLLHPELRHNMDYLSETYLRYRPIAIESLIGPCGKGQRTMREVPVKDVCEYAAEDADVTWQLMEHFRPLLAEYGAEQLFHDIEMPLVPVLAEMEEAGVTLDTEALRQSSDELNTTLRNLEEEIHTLAGMPFNINSSRQVGTVLFEHLRIEEKVKKTKTGLYSTGEEVLEKLRSKHPIVGKLLDYRRVKKLLSTYIDALPERVDPATGKIHTSFNQTVTSTGRLSSSNPNLQNIPVREELGREIRKAFTADDAESVFFSADYSQIELRIMAHFSGDEHMTDAFRHGADIHAATAAKIFGVAPEEVTSDMRRRAKTANFGIIYGISAFGLAERLAIPRAEARELIDGYFASYPRIKAYMDASIQTATEQGYVETLFGRRLFLPDIRSRNAVVRGYAERGAINAPIQGTAADIIKIAMIGIRRRFRQEHLRSRMILQVHDELNFNVRKEELDVVRQIVREEMEGAAKLSVPLTVDCGVGRNWLEAH